MWLVATMLDSAACVRLPKQLISPPWAIGPHALGLKQDTDMPKIVDFEGSHVGGDREASSRPRGSRGPNQPFKLKSSSQGLNFPIYRVRLFGD